MTHLCPTHSSRSVTASLLPLLQLDLDLMRLSWIKWRLNSAVFDCHFWRPDFKSLCRVRRTQWFQCDQWSRDSLLQWPVHHLNVWPRDTKCTPLLFFFLLCYFLCQKSSPEKVLCFSLYSICSTDYWQQQRSLCCIASTACSIIVSLFHSQTHIQKNTCIYMAV